MGRKQSAYGHACAEDTGHVSAQANVSAKRNFGSAGSGPFSSLSIVNPFPVGLECHERRMTATHAFSTLLEGESPKALEGHLLLAAVLMSASTYS